MTTYLGMITMKIKPYPPLVVLNPLGFGMWFCLNAMNDCIEASDEKMYDKWFELGLKYAHKFLENSTNSRDLPMSTDLAYSFRITV